MTCDRRLIAPLSAALLPLLALAGPARAEAPGGDAARNEARQIVEEGARLYQRGDYKQALARFLEAHARYPTPRLHFNLGQTHRKLGATAEAFEAFERFLTEATDAAAERREDAARFLVELRPHVGLLRVVAPAGAEIAIDDRPAGVAPLPRSIAVAPGRRQVAVRRKDRPMPLVHTMEVPAGGSVEWAVPADPAPRPVTLASAVLATPAPSPASSPSPLLAAAPVIDVAATPPPPRRRWWPWAVAAVVVAGAGVTAALMLGREGALPAGSLGAADGRAPGH